MLIQTARVLVIDDVYDEVKQLLWILNKNGLAFNYFKGDDHRELPYKPLRGVRLLFLDFVLGTDGQTDDNKIAALMHVIQKTIAMDNGPYIILAWTKHDTPQDNLIDLFKVKIITGHGIPIPMAILNLEKSACMNSLTRTERNIQDKINDKQILEILLEWEGHGKNALSEVVRELSTISEPQTTPGQTYDQYSSDWNSKLERHIYRIAESAMGQNTKPDVDMLVAAQFSLTELFRDHVETTIRNETKPHRQLIRKICSHKDNGYTPDEKAYMNTSFLLVREGIPKKVQPGNIYTLTDVFEKIKCERRDCYYNKTRLTRQGVVREFYKGNLREYPRKLLLLKKAVPLLMEITPECDYAQKKWRNAKMLLGVMWPISLADGGSPADKLRSGDFIYKSPPIIYQDQNFNLAFNAHHLFNVSFRLLGLVAPILKARKEFLVDIQHWFSRHMSRPGKTEF